MAAASDPGGAIVYRRGDATRPEGTGPRVIAHVCNDVGGWGAGFVLALSRRWPEPEAEYRRWHAAGADAGFALGSVQLVPVEPALWVANLVAQRGVVGGPDGPPIRYHALARCLERLAAEASRLAASVHLPRIGCGLAGGRWDEVEPLLERHLVAAGVAVTVYDLH